MSERMEQLLEAARRTDPVSPEAIDRIARRGPPAEPSRRPMGVVAAVAVALLVVVAIEKATGEGSNGSRVAPGLGASAEVGAFAEVATFRAPDAVGPISEMGASSADELGPRVPSDDEASRAAPRLGPVVEVMRSTPASDDRRSRSRVDPGPRRVLAQGGVTGPSEAIDDAPSPPSTLDARPSTVDFTVEPSDRSLARGRPKGARRTLPPYRPRAIRELLAIGSQRLAERAVDDEVRRILALTDRRAMLAGLDRLVIADADLLAFRGALRAADARCAEALADFSDVDRIAPRSEASSYASLARRWCGPTN